MQPQNSGSRGGRFGLSLAPIILHSVWITAVGMVLFRLATANTQTVLYVKIFAIIATGPWIIQLLVSTTIIILYNANVYDLTWLVKFPAEEGFSRCQDSRAVDEDIEVGDVGFWKHSDNMERRLNCHGRTCLGHKFGLLEGVSGRSGPCLQRNRTF